MSKWAELVKYLNTTNANPESVLKLIKNTWKPKGSGKTYRIDDYNTLRRAWKYHVVYSIHTSKEKQFDQKIWKFILSPSYKVAYASMHLGEKTKTEDQHFNACKKLYYTSKDIRDKLDKRNGEPSPTEIAEILLPLWKKPDGKIDSNQFIKDNEALLYSAFLEKGKKKNQQLNKKIFNKKKIDT